jgi:PKD domain
MFQLYAARPHNFWTPAGVDSTMLSMRLCAGLALSVAGLLALAPGAGAATYCPTPGEPEAPRDCIAAASPQQALDMAAAHAGFDTVVLGSGDYEVGPGLVYSDGAGANNGLVIESRTHCPDRYTCNTSTLRGGAPGTAVLTLSGEGGSDVSVAGVVIQAMDDGATGLVLGPGARSDGGFVSGGATGIRVEGSSSAPALVRSTGAGGATAVEAVGHGILENAWVSGRTGVRVPDGGDLDIRGGAIVASTGVVGTHVRIAGTAITLGESLYPPATDPAVGVEARCPDAIAGDASVEITNATIFARNSQGATNGAGATGVRATGRGGDGASCDSTVHMSSTIVWGAETSVDARGEAGSGTDPRGGTARIESEYSDFSAAAARTSAPATIETSSPGGNLDTDPLFVDGGWLNFYALPWNSPMVDAGDPAPPEDWQQPFIAVVHGRRDIGEFEYGFRRPELSPTAYPPRVATGAPVYISAAAYDPDPGEEVSLQWTLPDGTKSSEPVMTRRFFATGRYRFGLRVTDPTGYVAEGTAVAVVVRQRLSDLRVRPVRFRPAARRRDSRGAKIRFRARAEDTVVFRVHRAVHPRGSRRVRWKRVRGSFEYPAFEGENNEPFNGWLARRLRPGLYRLTARGRGEGTGDRTRFRILR